MVDDGFTGIYTISLPERCWDTKGNVLFYNDLQKSYVHIMSIDVTNGDVNCLTANTELGCYGVFDVYNDLLVGQYSNPCHPPKIVTYFLFFYIITFYSLLLEFLINLMINLSTRILLTLVGAYVVTITLPSTSW